MRAGEGAVGYYSVDEGLVDGGAEEGAVAVWKKLVVREGVWGMGVGVGGELTRGCGRERGRLRGRSRAWWWMDDGGSYKGEDE